MTPDEFDEQHSAMQEERRHLASLAFRMLGSVTGAEDAVQESYISWYYLTADEQDAVETPRTWLTRAVSRACLNKLTNADRERAHHSEAWLPKSRHTDDEETRFEVTEAMTPAERVSLVLDALDMTFEQMAEILDHSPAVCQRITDAARRRTAERRSQRTERAQHDDVVTVFASAAHNRDKAALLAVMDPHVRLEPSYDGNTKQTRRRVYGAANASLYILSSLERCPAVAVLPQDSPIGLGLALWDDGRIVAAVSVAVRHQAIAAIQLQGAHGDFC